VANTWDVPLPGEDEADDLRVLAPLAPECLVPILDHAGQLSGLLVLGQRLSEEPYSSEDKRPAGFGGQQAGIAIENFGLAEKMARADGSGPPRGPRHGDCTRSAIRGYFLNFSRHLQNAAIYGDLQSKLALSGGDYYDFLDLGTGRLGIVLADISGKGIAAALLMANLQANLRSRYMVALEDPHQLLQVRESFVFENTPEDSYATLFYADYDDANHCLRYANCGHNPPLLLAGEWRNREAWWRQRRCWGLFSNLELRSQESFAWPRRCAGDLHRWGYGAPNEAGEEFGESRLMKIVGGAPTTPGQRASLHDPR